MVPARGWGHSVLSKEDAGAPEQILDLLFGEFSLAVYEISNELLSYLQQSP